MVFIPKDDVTFIGENYKYRDLEDIDSSKMYKSTHAVMLLLQFVRRIRGVVVEFCERGAITHVLQGNPALITRVAYATEALSALAFMHSTGHTHRDIKPGTFCV